MPRLASGSLLIQLSRQTPGVNDERGALCFVDLLALSCAARLIDKPLEFFYVTIRNLILKVFKLRVTHPVTHRAAPLLSFSASTPAFHLCISLSSTAFVGTAIPA
jgi:hypothetical protein